MSITVAGTIVGFTVAGIRILRLRAKKKSREREIEALEREDRIVFHEEIDDIDVIQTAKTYFVSIVCLFTIPMSFAAVDLGSCANAADKMIAAIGIVAWYHFAWKFVEDMDKKTGRR